MICRCQRRPCQASRAGPMTCILQSTARARSVLISNSLNPDVWTPVAQISTRTVPAVGAAPSSIMRMCIPASCAARFALGSHLTAVHWRCRGRSSLWRCTAASLSCTTPGTTLRARSTHSWWAPPRGQCLQATLHGLAGTICGEAPSRGQGVAGNACQISSITMPDRNTSMPLMQSRNDHSQ